MTDDVLRVPERVDTALPDLSKEALLDVLDGDESALANSVRSVVDSARKRAEKYAAFGNAPSPAK